MMIIIKVLIIVIIFKIVTTTSIITIIIIMIIIIKITDRYSKLTRSSYCFLHCSFFEKKMLFNSEFVRAELSVFF